MRYVFDPTTDPFPQRIHDDYQADGRYDIADLARQHPKAIYFDVTPEDTTRSYAVGLPVIIHVHDSGEVTYEVDFSEAAREIRRGDWEEFYTPPIPSEVSDGDAVIVEDAVHNGLGSIRHG